MKRIFTVLLPFLLISCSDGLENLGSISVENISSENVRLNETIIELKKGDVIELWNDMSIETKKKGKAEVNYFVQHYLDGEFHDEIEINALKTNPTLLESKEMSRGRMIWSFQGKIEVLKISESGKHIFKAAVFTNDNELILNRASLVFKRRND